ncbi:nuclear transport factor 2 family protein [Streptomyces chartreusis]|uniref:nuclear transport factor 2 family protein n=1 Tax=Streptomyces chartreusis TaxID=1969 RepID=UPI0033C4A6C4
MSITTRLNLTYWLRRVILGQCYRYMGEMDVDMVITPLEVYRRSLDLLIAGDMGRWIDLWSDTGVLEFPFAPAGAQSRVVGKAAVKEYMHDYPEQVRLHAFRDFSAHLTQDPEVIVAEVRTMGVTLSTGRPYVVPDISVVRVRDGLIASYRSYWNPLAILESFTGADPAWVAQDTSISAKGSLPA